MAHQVVDVICDYYNKVESLPVKPSIQPGDIIKTLPSEAPAQPESFDKIMDDFNDKLMPGGLDIRHS